MPAKGELSRYFHISGKTVKRAIGEGEDEEADEKTDVLGFHQCNEDDQKYFYDLRDLNTAHLDKVWQYMYCLDDPESVEFQGGPDLAKEQTLEISITACKDK